MVILATRNREIGSNPLLDVNCAFDANKEREFSVKIARCNWTKDMTFGNLVYVPDTEFGGIIEDVLTDTTLDYVELKRCLRLLREQPMIYSKLTLILDLSRYRNQKRYSEWNLIRMLRGRNFDVSKS